MYEQPPDSESSIGLEGGRIDVRDVEKSRVVPSFLKALLFTTPCCANTYHVHDAGTMPIDPSLLRSLAVRPSLFRSVTDESGQGTSATMSARECRKICILLQGKDEATPVLSF